jgi:hypothetical protein
MRPLDERIQKHRLKKVAAIAMPLFPVPGQKARVLVSDELQRLPDTQLHPNVHIGMILSFS